MQRAPDQGIPVSYSVSRSVPGPAGGVCAIGKNRYTHAVALQKHAVWNNCIQEPKLLWHRRKKQYGFRK